MKLKKTILFVILVAGSLSGFGQAEWSVKAGGGTSWILFPKVFLVNPNNLQDVWEIGPAANHATFYLGGDIALGMGDHWFWSTGLTLNYLSGEIRVTTLELGASARKLQNYTRLELPLIFGVKSSDNFWVTFGPQVFITLADNKGLVQAIEEFTSADNVNTAKPIGVAANIGMGVMLSDNLYLNTFFMSDFGKRFDYEDGIYEVRLSMQGIVVGLGYTFSK